MWLCRYVECTSAAIQALTLFKKLYPGHRREEIENCIAKAAHVIEKIQASDGSWFASTIYLLIAFCLNEIVPLSDYSLLLWIFIYLSKRNFYLCIQLVLSLICLAINLGILPGSWWTHPININMLSRYGSWGVCFTYGGWFGIKGLVAAGKTYENCSNIRKACDYLLSKEIASGGWGESYLSCQDKVLWSYHVEHILFSCPSMELILFLVV